MHLRLYDNDRATFLVANAMADKLGWGLFKFREARRESCSKPDCSTWWLGKVGATSTTHQSMPGGITM